MKPLVRAISLMFLLGAAACAGASQAPDATPTPPAPIAITSPAFEPGGAIPKQYTCEGDDISPPLEWADPPAGTQSLALIMDDPDAPMRTWVHWVVYNLPPDARALADGASKANGKKFNLPQGAVQGTSSFKRADYGGPCPPAGQHHYVFHLYALDAPVEGKALDKEALLKAMEGHILAYGELVGVFSR